jgi:hypothetical protein
MYQGRSNSGVIIVTLCAIVFITFVIAAAKGLFGSGPIAQFGQAIADLFTAVVKGINA